MTISKNFLEELFRTKFEFETERDSRHKMEEKEDVEFRDFVMEAKFFDHMVQKYDHLIYHYIACHAKPD